VTVDEIRRIALGLPEVVELDHHGMPSFRLNGKIFATLPPTGHVNILFPAEEADEALACYPDLGTVLWWGARRSGLQVEIAAVTADVVADLLESAWASKAPKRLLAEFDGRSGRRAGGQGTG
jgi:hypothetical protein